MNDLATKLVILWRDDEVEGWTALQRGMQEALLRLGVPAVHRQRSDAMRRFARLLSRAGLVRRVAPLGKRRLVTLAWRSDGPAFPDAYWCELVPWIYDCWGPNFDEWERLLRRNRVRLAFFTARAAAEHFARKVPGLTTRWLPECHELRLLSPSLPLRDRPVHVLELGRRLASVHDGIRGPLERAGKQHLYDKGSHASAVPGLDALYKKMGESAVVVCYPKARTHPEGAGGVETVTQRYFETLGSGCLAVGQCPAELRDLYGFDPVIALRESDPGAHMLEILADLGSYQAHVDRCLARTREVGHFDIRAKQMLDAIAAYDNGAR